MAGRVKEESAEQGNKQNVRDWLVFARRRQNMTQAEVAVKSGISRPFYVQLERSLRDPSPQVAKRIAGLLKCDWTYFYEDPENIPKGPL